MDNTDQRIQQIIKVIQKIASGDYSARIPVSKTKDDIDGIATGINMLSEEIEAMISQHYEENKRLQETIKQWEKTTDQLNKSEELFRKAFQASPDSLIISRLDNGLLVDVNNGFCTLVGYSRQEAIGKTAFELDLWVDTKERDTLVSELQKKGICNNLEIKFYRKDRAIRNTLLSAIILPLDDGPHMLTITRDITEIKAAEENLKSAKDRFENLVRSSPDGIVVFNKSGVITTMNSAFCRTTEMSEADLLGMHFTKFRGLSPRDIAGYVKKFTGLLKGSIPDPFEIKWKDKKGNTRFSEIHVTLLKQGKKISGIQVIIRDITERIQTLEALKSSEIQYRTSMDSMHESIYVVNHKLQIILANNALIEWLKDLGLPHDPVGKKFYEVFPFLKNSVREEYMDIIQTGKTIHKEDEYRLGDTLYFTDTKMIPIYEGKKVQRVLTIVRDTTEQMKANRVREIMYRISNAVNLASDLYELYYIIRDELGKIFDTTNFFIALYNKDNDTLTLPFFVDEKDHFDSFPAKKTLTGYVIRNDKPLLVNDSEINKLVKRGEVEDVGTPSKIWLGVPMKIKEEIIGALVVQSYDNEKAYSEQDLEILKFVSTQIGLSIETKRAYDEVQVEKAYFEQLFESAPETIVLTDNNGKLLRVNNEFEKLFGYTAKEAIGKYIDKLIVPEQYQKEAISISKKVASGEKIWIETIRKDKNGKKIYVSVLGTPVEIEGGQVGVYGIYRDITDRKKAQIDLKDSEEKLRNILYSSPDAITVSDLRGNITECNPAAYEMFGFTKPEELIGTKAIELVADTQREKSIVSLKQVLRKGFIKNIEFELKTSSGKHIFVELSASLLKNQDDRPIGIVTVTKDISERREYEANLQSAKEKAEESDRLKSAFLANMSHEIRTPMNAILGFSELLRNEKITKDERDEYIKIINNKGNELLLIINDIIDISKIEAGDIKIFPAEIQINSFLREIFDSLNEEKNLMNKENIQLRLNISNEYNPVLHSDPARLRQIIYNLFTNALKFTNEGYVEIGYEFLDNKRIKFYVTDTGVGIPEDKQDIVFDRFRQVDESISPQHGGTGLGLAISKNLVELLGGEISLQSHPKHGSTFWFTLPVIKKVKEKKTIETDDKKKRKAETDIIDLSGHSILIAEDDASNYLFIESFLRRAKARIIWAKDGIQALETMKEDQDIHIVLMDLRMPKMNGIEATREIRKIRKSVPIIALTAYAFANDRQKALNAGCNAYLSKPVKLDELSDVIIRLLNEK